MCLSLPLLPFSPCLAGDQVGAQNCCLTGTGAFTGEIAASQLKDFGLKWTITGHSERREVGGH